MLGHLPRRRAKVSWIRGAGKVLTVEGVIAFLGYDLFQDEKAHSKVQVTFGWTGRCGVGGEVPE